MANGQIIRQHILFYGRVQGVGFRWHARNFALAKGLTGWVQNLEDGSVEMEIQGTEEKIDALVQYMEQREYVLIEDMKIKKVQIVENEWDFSEKCW